MRNGESQQMSDRRSWDEYFLRIAVETAARATCSRKHVGAVLAKNKRQLVAGYNGSVAGLDHCDDVGHMMEDGHCVRTIHAEVNAIITAASEGISIRGADCYVTCRPCWNCFKSMANAGIKRIVYIESYRDDDRVTDSAARLGIELIQMDPDKPKPWYRILSRDPKQGPLSWYVADKSGEKTMLLDALSSIEYRNIEDVLTHPEAQILEADDEGSIIAEKHLGFYIDVEAALEHLSEIGMLHKIE